jgi:hydrogenase maturation protease
MASAMENPPAAGKIRVIGVGNILLKDEGIGVRVIEALQQKRWPPSVELIDGGVAGFALIELLTQVRKVLLIDAAQMDLCPGTIRRFSPEEVSAPEALPRFSMHDVGLPDVLALSRLLDPSPREIVIFGIQPKEIALGLELSEELQAAVPQAAAMVVQELEKEGVEPLP